MHAEREIIQKAKDTHIHTYVQHCVCVVQQLAQRGTGLREQRGRQGLRAAAQKRVSTGTHAGVYVHTHTHTPVCAGLLLLSHQGRNKSITE